MKHPYRPVQLTSPLRVLRGASAAAATTEATTRDALATTTGTAAIASERAAIIAPVVIPIIAVIVTRLRGLKVFIPVKVTDDVARAGLGDVVDRVVGQHINLEISVVLVLSDNDASGIFKEGVGDEFLCLMSD